MNKLRGKSDAARWTGYFQRAAFAALLAALPVHAGTWYDDFESGGLDEWEIYAEDPEFESWEEKDGVAAGQIFYDEPDVTVLSILQLKPIGEDPSGWKNYTVRARMRLESEPQEDDTTLFGVIVYDRLDETMYHLCLLHFQESSVWVHIRSSPDDRNTEMFPFQVERKVWYNMTVRVETMEASENVTVQIDDNPPMSVDWETKIESGGVGLVVGDSIVSFDDFELEGDNIPDGGPGFPLQAFVSPAGKAAQVWGKIKKQYGANVDRAEP